MELDSLKGNIAWQHFNQLASAAKTRNAGFSVPFHTDQLRNTDNAGKMAQNCNILNNSQRLIHYPEKSLSGVNRNLGTKFDAYA